MQIYLNPYIDSDIDYFIANEWAPKYLQISDISNLKLNQKGAPCNPDPKDPRNLIGLIWKKY